MGLFRSEEASIRRAREAYGQEVFEFNGAEGLIFVFDGGDTKKTFSEEKMANLLDESQEGGFAFYELTHNDYPVLGVFEREVTD